MKTAFERAEEEFPSSRDEIRDKALRKAKGVVQVVKGLMLSRERRIRMASQINEAVADALREERDRVAFEAWHKDAEWPGRSKAPRDAKEMAQFIGQTGDLPNSERKMIRGILEKFGWGPKGA